MRILEILKKSQLWSILLAWVTVTKILVTVFVSVVADVFSLLVTLITTMQVKPWVLILLWSLILWLLLSMLPLLQDGFGLPTNLMRQRMPLIMRG
jgi:hypothetical protein